VTKDGVLELELRDDPTPGEQPDEAHEDAEREGSQGTGDATCQRQSEPKRVREPQAAARAHELRRDLPGLTGGEGVLESEFAGYLPVTGEPPRRPARDIDAYRRAGRREW
jgi:hypothetical protein